jgi:ABC-type transporter Mla subunit MlaD
MSSTDAWHYALTGFLVVTGLGLLFVLVQLGGTLGKVNQILDGVMGELLPMLGKVSITLDHVNDELGKVGHVTDSAVDAADKLDHIVRTLSGALGKPVKVASGVTAGISHAFGSFRSKRDQRGGVV